MSDVWYARLLTFGGIVGGATHYQVRMACFTKPPQYIEVEVEWEIDEGTAVNRRRSDESVVDKAGDRSGRFNSRDDAIKAAKRAWLVVSEKGDALLLAHSAQVDFPGVDRVLEAPADMREEIDAKIAEFGLDDHPASQTSIDAMDDWWFDYMRDRFPRTEVDHRRRELVVVLSSDLLDLRAVEG